MQRCTMNGDTITRHDDGTLYINGNKVIENELNTTDKFELLLYGFCFGLATAAFIFYMCGV